MPVPLLEVRELTVRFRESVGAVLDGITFELSAGESVAVVGESGAGKSTLARSLLRLLPAGARFEGSIYLRGTDVLGAGGAVLQGIRGAQISLIPQDPELALNPVMRVCDHVEEILRAHVRLSRRERRNRAQAALAMTGLGAELTRAYPHQLSGGQRQRVVIALALVTRPAVLVADEPTSALDTVLQAEILSLLKDLIQGFGLTLLFITHDATLVHGLADRVIVMREGRVLESGGIQQIFHSQNPYTAKLIGSVAPLPLLPKRTQAISRDANGCSSMPGRPSEQSAVIELRGISKAYPAGRFQFRSGRKAVALNQVSLSMISCSALALVGRSGSGKSTLARCLALLEKPDSGEIFFRGESLLNRSRQERRWLHGQIQLVWQHSALALNPRFKAVDLASEPLRVRGLTSRADSRDQAFEMMAKVGLPSSLGLRTPLQLSGGQRQRLALARALVIRPAVLILDEAFAGLDLPLQDEIAAMLQELKSSLSLSYLFITHDLRRAASFADEIAVMQEGKVVERGDPQTLFWSPKHEATRQLVQAVVQI